MSNAETDPTHEEGPSTAAYDFNDARFRIHQAKELVRQAELSRRRGQITLIIGAPALLAVLLVLNLARFADGSPLHVSLVVLAAGNVVAGAALLAVLIFGVRVVRSSRHEIDRARIQLGRLREAERDARARMVSGGLTRLLWIYHSDVLATIEEYRDHARKYRRIHNRFQTIIIIGSLLTTAIATASAKYSFLQWVTVVVSFAVGVSAGMTGYFKFRERSMNLQQAADELELEYKAAELGIRAYRKHEEVEERLLTFAERAETIKDEQRKREQQLEQPPEANSTSANTSNTAS